MSRKRSYENGNENGNENEYKYDDDLKRQKMENNKYNGTIEINTLPTKQTRKTIDQIVNSRKTKRRFAISIDLLNLLRGVKNGPNSETIVDSLDMLYRMTYVWDFVNYYVPKNDDYDVDIFFIYKQINNELDQALIKYFDICLLNDMNKNNQWVGNQKYILCFANKVDNDPEFKEFDDYACILNAQRLIVDEKYDYSFTLSNDRYRSFFNTGYKRVEINIIREVLLKSYGAVSYKSSEYISLKEIAKDIFYNNNDLKFDHLLVSYKRDDCCHEWVKTKLEGYLNPNRLYCANYKHSINDVYDFNYLKYKIDKFLV